MKSGRADFPGKDTQRKTTPRMMAWGGLGPITCSPVSFRMPSTSGEPVCSLVGLVLPNAGVGAVHLGTLLLGELHCVMGLLLDRIIQPQQAGGDALSVGRGDRGRRNQRDQCR